MRTRPPTIRVDGPQVTVGTEVVFDDGSDLPILEVTFPAGLVDWLDPTATPALPLLAAMAAARGETVHVGGSADGAAARTADDLARRLARRWGQETAGVEVAETHTAPFTRTEGAALIFDRSIGAWAALLEGSRADGRPGTTNPHPISYLVVVAPSQPSPVSGVVGAGHAAVAQAGWLGTIDVTTNGSELLAWVGAPDEARSLVELSAALTVGMGVRRLLVPAPLEPSLLPDLTGGPDLVAVADSTTVFDQVRLVADDPRARMTVHPCTEPDRADNCGRCPSCLVVRSVFVMDGHTEPLPNFAAPLDPRAVREASIPADLVPSVEALIEGLPPGHEALRRAWVDARARTRGQPSEPRWGDWDVPGLAGPGVPERVASTGRAVTGHPDLAASRPLGWQPGTVALRPALPDHARIRALAATAPGRPQTWTIVEHHIRHDDQDGAQAALALRCLDAHGPGLVYLPGILWAPEQPPALGPDAVARLLGAARVRLWWRDDGDLEPLRVVESVEHGCLPIQVMPPGPARDLRRNLPDALSPLVVADDELTRLDLGLKAVSTLASTAFDHLLARAAEHDLTGVLGD